MKQSIWLSILGLAGCSGGDPTPARFRAVFISDTHIAGPQYECCSESTDSDNSSIVKTEDRLREVVARINAIEPPPDMVFVLGDVMHNPYYSMERDWYFEGTNAWTITSALLDEVDVPVYPLWGNHDYDVGCDKTEYVSREMTHDLIASHFDAEPYYAVEHKGWKFILANSQLGPTWEPGHALCDTGLASYGVEQLAWIDQQLAEGMPTMFMAHYMLPVTQQNEAPGSANPDLETVLGRHAGGSLALTMVGHSHRWVDFGEGYPFPHYVIPATRYDTDNFWMLELTADGAYEILDYDKGPQLSPCADTWTYDGDPASQAPQPPEDGDC